MKKLFIIIVMLLGMGICKHLVAQDMHLSHFWLSRGYLNPAMCGAIEEDYRATVIHKNQWSAVGTPFKNSLLTTEIPFLRKRGNPNHFGAGLSLFQSTAGTSALKLLSVEGHIAWHQSLGLHDRLAVGLTAAMVQRSVNFEGLLWDSQYNGAGVDPTLDSGESFASESILIPDGAIGIYWQHAAYHQFAVGYSAKHFFQNHGFLENTTDAYILKQSLYGEWKQDVGEFEIEGNGILQLQNSVYEAVVGCRAGLQIGSDSKYTTNKTSSKVIGGAAYRWGDAIVATLGYEFKKSLLCMVSYDFNSSALNQSTNWRGAWEISLSFSGWKESQRRKLN